MSGMTRLRPVVALLLLAGTVAAIGTRGAHPSTPVVAAARATSTSTSAVPPPTTSPPTTEAPQAVRKPVSRASRGSNGRTPPTTLLAAPEASAPPAPAEGECGAWGYKTRARSDECWRGWVAQYGDWPVERMLAILYCESKGNPWVVNSSNHVGLFQIKNSHTKGDGPGNIAHAHGMWLNSGTAPWRQCGG